MNKYHNIKVTYDGYKFDSLSEKNFYIELLQTHKKENIIVHPKFVLQEGFKNHGKTYRPITYSGDFQIGIIIYDVKGSLSMMTQASKLKHKLFAYKFPTLNLILAIHHKNEWLYYGA